MSTSHPPDVIHVIGVPRPSLFFALFRVLYRTKNGGDLGTRLDPCTTRVARSKASAHVSRARWVEAFLFSTSISPLVLSNSLGDLSS